MRILAGDIGGTKTHLALVDANDPRKIIKERKYLSKEYPNLEKIIIDFLHGESSIAIACFGIAGPIEHGVCRATNLPWVIDASEISKQMDIGSVYLLNDLEANAWGVGCLSDGELMTLNEGERGLEGNMALIAAGTGLGEAGFFYDGKRHHPFACEGGHCDFAPTDLEQVELWQYLNTKFDHVSYERVLSGPGLYNLYQFYIETGKVKENPKTKEVMQKEDPSRVVTDMALKNECDACQKALALFVQLYGQEAGNLALKFLSFAGIYIGGGIAPKIASVMKGDLFMKGFVQKGRFHKILMRMPIKLILNENTALLGAARYASEKRGK